MKSCIEIEEWRDVIGFEGLYYISSLEKVKNSKGQILKPSISNGYKVVSLSKNKIKTQGKVHRMLAMAFPELVGWTDEAKGKPFEDLVVNHKDENKLNNSVDNLEWCTNRYNLTYGTAQERSRLHRDYTSLETPIYQCSLDGEIICEYKSLADCVKYTGYDVTLISKVCRNKGYYKTAYGYMWKYKN